MKFQFFFGVPNFTASHQTYFVSHVKHMFVRRVSVAVPRAGPRNMRVFDATTSSLTIGWDHAEGPVRQYRIGYAPKTGDPITEFVSALQKLSTTP